MDQKLPDYDVTLSFAGEDRDYVEKVAAALQTMGIRYFYDKDEEVALWGEDLYTYLEDIYFRRSKFVVVFVSKHYKNKLWANHELKSAQARAFRENGAYILPARFDDTEILGILPTRGYIDVNGLSPHKLAEKIRQKLESLGLSAIGQEVQAPMPKTALSPMPMPQIKRDPTDKQRRDFLFKAFETIQRDLENALKQLSSSQPGVETTFNLVNTSKFICEIYLNGEFRNGCKIWIGGFSSSGSSINYASGRFRTDTDNSYNEVLVVESGGASLFLKPLMTPSNSQQRLTPRQAAEHLWEKLTQFL